MPRLLLVEGNAPTRELVARTLSDAGHEVVLAADARAAYEAYATFRPDAVVLAADLDQASDLARRLRESDPRAVLVLADWAHLGSGGRSRAALPLEPDAYVADPTKRELVEKIGELVARAGAARPRLRGVRLVLSRAPSSQGDLKPGVVARLLHQIWRSLSGGALVLGAGSAERRVLFLRGVPVGFESEHPAESLARWLEDAGRMDEAAHQAALDAMASGLSPGAALIAAGVLEPGEPLQATMRAWVRAMVVRCVALRDGRWRFHPGDELGSQALAPDLLPLEVLLAGARAGIPFRHFSEALRAVRDAYPVRTREFQQIVSAAGLGSADVRIALAIDGRSRTRDFLEERATELKAALSLLWFLSMVGAVVFHETPAESAAAGSAPERPASSTKKPLPADRAEALRQAALQILPGTYFRALGVDIAADEAEVERAYAEVASRFHADGFAEYEVGDLADLLSSVQDKVTAAYRVLSNGEKRRAYLSFLLLKLELAGQRRPGIDVDAEVALRRGERALRARRPAEAVAALRDAAERNPREPEYAAMLAFAALHDPTLPRPERVQDAKRHARRALALAPDHPRATAVLALGVNAEGDAAEARRLLTTALRARPDSELLKKVLLYVNHATG